MAAAVIYRQRPLLFCGVRSTMHVCCQHLAPLNRWRCMSGTSHKPRTKQSLYLSIPTLACCCKYASSCAMLSRDRAQPPTKYTQKKLPGNYSRGVLVINLCLDYFSVTRLQIETRFQSGSENMLPTPWPSAEMRLAEIL